MPPKLTSEKWEPRQKYHVADFGCGLDAEKIIELAREHPDRHFLGITKVLSPKAVETAHKLGNLHLVEGNATELVGRLHPSSLHGANADFFLNNLHGDERLKFLSALRAGMSPDASLHISHKRAYGQKLMDVVGKAGFVTSESESIRGSVHHMTQAARDMAFMQDLLRQYRRYGNIQLILDSPRKQQLLRSVYEHLDKDPADFEPMRFTARLKD